jgi:hypothetical protein
MEKGLATENRNALMSSEIFEKHRYKLSLNAHKLLIGLIQNNDHINKIFPEVGYDIHGLFVFLGIEKRNDRYDVVRRAFAEIMENPLEVRYHEKKWSGVAWLSSYEYDESESSYVKVSMNPKIDPYLLHFDKYLSLNGKYITSFKSDYAIRLYPLFRWILEAKYGKYEITIQRLKEYTYTDDPKEHPAYNTHASATNNFLRKVLGISMNQKTKHIEILPKSPILEINENTDIVVNVTGFAKKGTKYTGVIFNVNTKASAKALADPQKQRVHKVSDVKSVQISIPLKDFFEGMHMYNKQAKETGNKELNIHEYADMTGYIIHSNSAHKKMSDKERQEAIRARDTQTIIQQEKEQKRSWKTEDIKEVFARHRQTNLFDLIEQKTNKTDL